MVEDRSGSVAVIFATSIIFVLLAIGLAIDGARAYNMSSRIASALDAAALAAAKMLDNEDNSNEDIEERARRFFAAHFVSTPVAGVDVGEPEIVINRSTGEVEVAVNVTVPTTFGQLAGINKFELPRSTRVRYDQRRIEFAMVLDTTGSMCDPCDKIEGLKSAARELVANIITPQTSSGFVRVAIAPYAAAVNAGSFAGSASGGQSTDGCVVERTGGANATDAPPGGDALGTSDTALNPNYQCPTAAIMPMSADAASLRAHIDSLATGGWTAGHIGLAWGWYLVSHRWYDFWPSESRPRTPAPNVIKAVLLMTDGEFNTSYIPGAGLNSAAINVANSSPEQAARLCSAMKADGVIVYTVAFQAPAAAQTLLASCATSPSHYFATSNNTDLVNAFRIIAERLLALRVTL